jgi:hypothetical protein
VWCLLIRAGSVPKHYLKRNFFFHHHHHHHHHHHPPRSRSTAHLPHPPPSSFILPITPSNLTHRYPILLQQHSRRRSQPSWVATISPEYRRLPSSTKYSPRSLESLDSVGRDSSQTPHLVRRRISNSISSHPYVFQHHSSFIIHPSPRAIFNRAIPSFPRFAITRLMRHSSPRPIVTSNTSPAFTDPINKPLSQSLLTSFL